MKPKISVIIPVYNVEKYLPECLNSILAQTYPAWEAICVDDGSTDSSLAILDEYAGKDSRLTIVRRNHSNAGVCRNVGLDIAQGEYLYFLDSDDVFAPRMFEIMLDMITRFKAEIAICGHYDFQRPQDSKCFKMGRRTLSATHSISCPGVNVDIFDKWIGWPWDKLFKRDFIIHAGLRFQECPSTNDLAFVFSALSIANRISETDTVLVAHRKHQTSIESSIGPKHPGCVCEALSNYRKEMIRLGHFPTNTSLMRNFLNYALRFSVSRMCRSRSYAEYEKVYASFVALLATLEIEKYDSCWFQRNIGFYKWAISVNDGAEAFPSLMFLLNSQIAGNNSLRRSKAYRLGRWILAPMRRFREMRSHI